MDELSFRPITNADLPFLRELYGTIREPELLQTNWATEQKREFVEMQFEAQHQHYQQYFSAARFDIVLKNNRPIGRLYVDRRADEIRIIDIALMPDHRRKGIGGKLIRQLLEEGAAKKRPVRIHVEQFNPAMKLYERLGFQKIGDEGVYFLMEWALEA